MSWFTIFFATKLPLWSRMFISELWKEDRIESVPEEEKQLTRQEMMLKANRGTIFLASSDISGSYSETLSNLYARWNYWKIKYPDPVLIISFSRSRCFLPSRSISNRPLVWLRILRLSSSRTHQGFPISTFINVAPFDEISGCPRPTRIE